MRPYQDAAKCWLELKKITSFSDLKDAVKDPQSERVSVQGLRSVLWKAFLLFENLDRTTWPKRLQDSRAAYTSLRTHVLRAIEHPEEIESSIDPLSESEESPWAALRQDEALRAEILQDVDRCMPENLYFRQPIAQKMLLDILFIFSKLNPDISYRQGMHELLAPVLWVVERDAIEQEAPHRGEDHDIFTVFDSNYIEHDTFTLFALMMQSAKTFYEAGIPQGKEVNANTEAPIVLLSKRVFEEYLPGIDPDLASHLHEIAIVPQVFLMRWARLLFGREFSFDGMLQMWDVIFAEDPTLKIVEMVCVVMLLRIRWQLVEADYSMALTLLLRYPEPPNTQGPRTFVSDAVFLKSHFHSDGGSHIVHKYTGRHLPLVSQAGTVSDSPDIPTFAVAERSRSPPSAPQRASQPAGLENLLQDAARGILKRGGKIGGGVNQAVRDAVGEVRKNVQGLQAGRGSPRASSSASSKSPTNLDMLLEKVSRLEERNRALAKMLEGAVAELWDHQKSVSEAEEAENADGDSINSLNMAIARVQFVQVYLEDSSMALPEDDARAVESASGREMPNPKISAQSLPTSPNSSHGSEDPGPKHASHFNSEGEKAEHEEISQPDSKPNRSPSPPKSRHKPKPVSTTSRHALSTTQQIPATAPSSQASFSQSPTQPSSTSTNLNAPRPSLAQSSFSWMLGDGNRRNISFVSASPFPAEKRRHAGNSKTDFLFGDEDGFEGAETKGGSKSKKGDVGGLSEVFDLGEMDKGGG